MKLKYFFIQAPNTGFAKAPYLRFKKDTNLGFALRPEIGK